MQHRDCRPGALTGRLTHFPQGQEVWARRFNAGIGPQRDLVPKGRLKAKPTSAVPAVSRLLASLRDAGARRGRSGGLAALRPPATVFHPSGMNPSPATQLLARRRYCPGESVVS